MADVGHHHAVVARDEDVETWRREREHDRDERRQEGNYAGRAAGAAFDLDR